MESPYQSGAIQKMRERLVQLDGFMSANNVGTTVEDVGDDPIDVIPQAKDLADADMDCDNGYVAGTYCTMKTNGGQMKLFDAPCDALAGERVVVADRGSYVEDVAAWR
jgi:hypothetical protein